MKIGEIMSKKLPSIFLFISVFALSVLFTGAIINEKEMSDNNFTQPTVESEIQQTAKYRISVWDGKLAVFNGNSKLPYKVYNTYVYSLPEKDVEKIVNGIHVNSSSELLKIIEEYTS